MKEKTIDNKANTKDKGEPNLFYWENGLMVFTAKFHLQRGYCCKSGCRHCPYGFTEKIVR